MNDRLDELIRNTPRNAASAEFTKNVMSRIDETSRVEKARGWRPALAVAALVIVSILSGVAYQKHQEARRIEAIRLEARQLEAEIEALKKQSEKSSEVYLGGSENREYVLDLRDLTAPSSNAQTVSHSY